MNTIREGSRGEEVRLLQLALQRLGYLPGRPDGIFGPATAAAVIRFQQDYGLSPDGIAGPATWGALTPYLTGYTERRVVSGDTFWRIARIYGTSEWAIAAANPQKSPEDLQIGDLITVPYGFDVVPTDIPFTYKALQLSLTGLVKRYPFLRQGSIGRSVLGRELYSISVGNGSNSVMYNASHHANEWITTPVLLKYLEQLCKAYARGREIYGVSAATLLSRSTVNFIPMVNPDGVDLVTGWFEPGSEPYERAARTAAQFPSIPFVNGWKANINGTDLNLNYPANWERAREIKFSQGFTRPAPRDYVGERPLSAPESRAMERYTRENNFSLTLSYHSQGEIIYWKYLDYEPDRSYEIARMFSAVSGYSVEETPYASGFAGYKDWFIQTYNRPGYTIEVGRGVSPLPLEQFDRIYRDNAGILTLGAMV